MAAFDENIIHPNLWCDLSKNAQIEIKKLVCAQTRLRLLVDLDLSLNFVRWSWMIKIGHKRTEIKLVKWIIGWMINYLFVLNDYFCVCNVVHQMAFLDERGLWNSASHVSSRTSYLFSRFVRNVNK